MRPRGAVLLLIALLAACHSSQRDVLFAGDSNTKLMPCSYPNQWQAMHDPVTSRAYNDAIFGSTAQTWRDDGVLLERLEADQPTDVVIALGTNDIGGHERAGALVGGDLVALYRQAEAFTLRNGRRPRVFLATIPPFYDPPNRQGWKWSVADIARFNVQARAANAFIRLGVPATRVIDFDSWMPATWTAGFLWSDRDGIHLGCEAHAVRARKVDAALAE